MSLPNPYFSRDGVVLYHGDCREILPMLPKVDITVSSPPYNMIPKTKPSGIYSEHSHKLNHGYESHGDDMLQEDYETWIVGVFDQCRQITEGLVWINHKAKFIDKIARHPIRIFPWDLHSEIIWDRGGSLTLNANRYAPSHEMILGFGTPHYWDRCNDSKLTVWRINPEREIVGHPCPFPIQIPKRCIQSSCPPDGMVLDPFCGSGTTLRAAMDLGRKAIGIEISEKYCEITARRLEQRNLQFAEAL